MPATNGKPVPSGHKGSGTFWMAMWNIINGRGERLKQLAAGLAQMGISMAVLTEAKFVNNQYPKNGCRVHNHEPKGGKQCPVRCGSRVEGEQP
jgi:hypothetical protein